MTTLEVQPIWYKAQRVLRTIIQALLVLVPVVNGVALAVVAYLNEQADVEVPGTVFIWLNAAIAVTSLVMGLVARIMAVPGVNTVLTAIGLGSVPKRVARHVAGVVTPGDPEQPAAGTPPSI